MQILSEVTPILQDFGFLLREYVFPFGRATFITEWYRTVLL